MKAPQRATVRSPRDQHRAWLTLVDTEGPFLALPVLLQAWPQGMPQLDPARRAAMLAAKPAFDAAWDSWDRHSQDEQALPAYQLARDTWLDVAFREVFGWGDHWVEGDALTATARVTSPDGTVAVTPTGVVRHEDHVGLLVWVVDPVNSLRDPLLDGWAQSPIDRMEMMLRAADLPLGLVTDGRWWGLVSKPPTTLTASGIVDALTWVEEPEVRDAFVQLLSVRALLGGAEDHRVPVLFTRSVLAADQVTEALGVQVRRAVELVVAAFAESSAAAVERGEPDPLPDDGEVIYEAVVTVLMRVVFLLFAEERGLLPPGELYSTSYGLSDQIDVLQTRTHDEGETSLDSSHLTWHRVLATSHALYSGANFEDLRLPAYGGSLFDPSRFPFLTATTSRGTLALTVSDLVMFKVLDAVQTARVRGQDARRITFRDIDVEQIGYIYEGLLGYTCRRADDVVIGLIGREGAEAEIPLTALEDIHERCRTDAKTANAIIAWAKEHQPAAALPTAGQLTKALAAADTVADAELALRAITQDEELRAAVRPWIGVIRRDLRARPVVVEPGGWFVIETPSRRNAGAHYTPRDLAEEVVRHALEPIVHAPGAYQTPDRSAWRLKSATEVLDLKIADIACGSGAFLVAAARYLAARLLEAWQHERVATGISAHELEVKALREVVAHCLYGADINAMAVEMCKLSLWLVSLDRQLPFSFVDDKILHGNSLLGLTDLRQLEALHIAPPQQPEQGMFDLRGDELVERLDIDHRIDRAIQLRRQLATQIDASDPQRSANAKNAQMEQLAGITRDLRTVADAVVAAGLAVGGKPGKGLDSAYAALRLAVGKALSGASADLDAIIERGLTPTVPTDYARWRPLHWCLEVPDVMDRGGFDAIIGNPPFLGFKMITPSVGKNVRDWYCETAGIVSAGKADLVAFFFMRASKLVNSHGLFGLIATNTISEGDTREASLDLLDNSWSIYRAIRSRPWPTKLGVHHAVVWAARSPWEGDRILDGSATSMISPMLITASPRSHPVRLLENAQIAFQGAIPGGDGLLVDQATAAKWISLDSRNATVLKPILRGKDVTDRPDCSPTLWAIDFVAMSESEAQSYRLPFEHALTYSRPSRMREKVYSRRERWWLFSQWGASWRNQLLAEETFLALPITTKTGVPVRVSSAWIPSNGLEAFTSSSYAMQATLSSTMHLLWASRYGSTLETRPRYVLSDVFETFARPSTTERLETVGRELDEVRREIMLRRQLGLTKLYNLVNDPDVPDWVDPDVARMRQIHVELDYAVMAAYGWSDVPLEHGFHTYRQMTRWTVSPAARVEILDRLLAENHRRAALQADGPAPSPPDDIDVADGPGTYGADATDDLDDGANGTDADNDGEG